MSKLFTGVGDTKPTTLLSKEETDKLLKEKQDSQKRAEDILKKDKEDMQIECDRQILEFYKDTSYYEKFKKFTPLKEECIIKIFKYSADKAVASKGLLGKSKLILPSSINGGLTETTTANVDKHLPIIKIIRKGLTCKLNVEEGKLYVVALDDVEGYVFNPDYIWAMQNMAKQGSKNLTHIPSDMEQRIRKIDNTWSKYKFNVPNLLFKHLSEFKDVYLIPDILIKSEFIPDGVN